MGRVPPVYRRAIAFALSRMLASEDDKKMGIVSRVLLARIHRPFMSPSPAVSLDNPPEETSDTSPELSPLEALGILQTLLTNADPSPTFIASLLTPIIPALYAILSYLEATKTSDPALKEAVRGFLVTWGRIISASEGIAALWAVVLGEGGEWKADVAGSLNRVARHVFLCYEVVGRCFIRADVCCSAERKSLLSLFTPEDLRRAEEAGELDTDANLFDLRPDPTQFVRYLKSIGRSDISSELFVRLLEAYREVKAQAESDPLRYA